MIESSDDSSEEEQPLNKAGAGKVGIHEHTAMLSTKFTRLACQ